VHRNAVLVQEALRSRGSAAKVVELPSSTRTSAEAAASLGVAVGQIAKSLVFVADGAPVVAVLSGADRLDTAKLGRLLGARRVERADADAVREATGFPIGGVSPVGHAAPVVVDAALAGYDAVWAAAGTPNAVFETSYAELLTLAAGSRAADVRRDDGRPTTARSG
jgi:prolyl-tRNA editing enzyme YbaK/EbsC (Cys-tRNA(Pro) deacylase)